MLLLNKDKIIKIKGFDREPLSNFLWGEHEIITKTWFIKKNRETHTGFLDLLKILNFKNSNVYSMDDIFENLQKINNRLEIETTLSRKDKILYRRPRVEIKLSNGDIDIKHYKTYQDVIEACNIIKKRYGIDFQMI